MEGKQIGQYVILGKLGTGGMANVYVARHSRLGHVVALKILHTQYQQNEEIRVRFLDEARIQANLRHPNILTVQDILETDQFSGMVMDFMAGSSLDHVLPHLPNRQMTIPQSLALFMPLLDALQYAHDAEIVHRDLKPSNIFLQKMQQGVIPKLVDFGIAKLRSSALQSQVTAAGAMLGTPQFMAPEQFADSSTVDRRADIYAMGAVMFETLTGQYPFEATEIPEIMRAVITGELRKPSEIVEIDAEMESIIVRSMAQKKEERFQTATAMLNALRSIASRIPPHSLEPQQVPHADLKKRGINLNTPITSSGKQSIRTHKDTDTDAAPKQKTGRRATLWVIGLLTLVALAAGGWFLVDSMGNSQGDKKDDSSKQATEDSTTDRSDASAEDPSQKQPRTGTPAKMDEPFSLPEVVTVPDLVLGNTCEKSLEATVGILVNARLVAGWNGEKLSSSSPTELLSYLDVTPELLRQFRKNKLRNPTLKDLDKWLKLAVRPSASTPWTKEELSNFKKTLDTVPQLSRYVQAKAEVLCHSAHMVVTSDYSASVTESILRKYSLSIAELTQLDQEGNRMWLEAEIHTRAICCLLANHSVSLD